MTETPPDQEVGWIAYIEVPEVDAAVNRIDRLGGKAVQKPFEVPGIGRNALVRSPQGETWISSLTSIGLGANAYGTHSMRRTKVTQIYKKTGNLRAVQLILGHT